MQLSRKLNISEDTSKQVAFFLALFMGHFLIRALFTSPIEPWDAYWKWHPSVFFANGTFDPQKYVGSPFHHHSRWGVNFIVAAFIKLFGDSLQTYYSITIFVSTTFFVLFFYVAKKYLSTAFLILLVCLLLADPFLMRYYTHLHTRVFGSLFLLCSLLLINKNTNIRLALAALFLFAAYGAKETYGLFFGPALLILIFARFGLRASIVFSLITAALLLAETLIINQIWSHENPTWGRFELLLEGRHLKDIRHFTTTSLIKHIELYWLRTSWIYVAMASTCLIYGVVLLFSKKVRSRSPEFINGCVLVICIYLIGNTFAFIKLDPLTPLQPPKFKYFTPVLPFIFFISCFVLTKLFAVITPRWRAISDSLAALASIAVLLTAYITPNFLGLNESRAKSNKRWLPQHFHLKGTAFFWNAKENFDQMGYFLNEGYTLIVLGMPYYPFMYWTDYAVKEYNFNVGFKKLKQGRRARHKASIPNEELNKCIHMQGRHLFFPVKPASCAYWLRDPKEDKK